MNAYMPYYTVSRTPVLSVVYICSSSSGGGPLNGWDRYLPSALFLARVFHEYMIARKIRDSDEVDEVFIVGARLEANRSGLHNARYSRSYQECRGTVRF
jgi:hypothetical protein